MAGRGKGRGRGRGRGKKRPDPPNTVTVRSQPPNPIPLEAAKKLEGGIYLEDETYFMCDKGLWPQFLDINYSPSIIAPGAFNTTDDFKKKLRAQAPETLKKKGYVNFDPQIEEMRSSMEEWKKTDKGQKIMEKYKRKERTPEENQNIVPITEEPPPTEPEVANVPSPVLPQERMEVDSLAGPSTTITKTVEDKANSGEDRGPVAGSRSVDEMTDAPTPVVAKMVASTVQRVLRMKPRTARIGDGETNTRSEDEGPVAGPSGVGAAPAVNITTEEASVSTSASSIPSSGNLMVEEPSMVEVEGGGEEEGCNADAPRESR